MGAIMGGAIIRGSIAAMGRFCGDDSPRYPGGGTRDERYLNIIAVTKPPRPRS